MLVFCSQGTDRAWHIPQPDCLGLVKLTVRQIDLSKVVFPQKASYVENISISWHHQSCITFILLLYDYISMANCKTAGTPLLTHWSYCSLALSHRLNVSFKILFQPSLPDHKIYLLQYNYIEIVQYLCHDNRQFSPLSPECAVKLSTTAVCCNVL